MSLGHHLTLPLLREAFRRTRKDGAVGVDGQTAEAYAENLEGNLQDLLNRAKSGSYVAPPVRRTYIPKADGRQRPLGIPTFEDKVLQRAVAMVLEAIYEQDFMDCSYGFRPGRSTRGALQDLRAKAMSWSGGHVIEADIRDCFGALPHDQIRLILDQRVRDGVLTRLIGKWLNAGVLEDGETTHAEKGTPQGGVISPLLANIVLHTVLDRWFHDDVMPRMRGQVHLIRYADDFVILCEHARDAERIFAVLPKRFARFGLELHPDKTKLLDFRRPPDGGSPAPFDFLGFTHVWARTRRGGWAIFQWTSKSRLKRSLQAVAEFCQDHRHDPISSQHKTLCQKIRGHCAYFGIPGNSRQLSSFRWHVSETWRKWLWRRSNRAARTFEVWKAFCARWPLPPARTMHTARFPFAASP